ncbi:MAG: DNA primase [Thiotrichales bacterium]|nr:DNA primase [Thiotrichales bacterium]
MQGGNIPKSFIDAVIARADLVQLIGQRVPLKKAGTTYKACCPFHGEKTPSFNVNPHKQFYHCFGCGASGDALTFLMEYDGLSFVEAVETLAAQFGMAVPREQLTEPQRQAQIQQQEKQRDLFTVMEMAAQFYRTQLRDHPQAVQAKQYLRNRGLTPEIAKWFKIGFAPSGKDLLLKGLGADAQLSPQLLEAGLLGKSEDGRVFERFRDRIMFPIRDGRGRFIAFGGRILEQGQPKYLNSPETPIFHKSHTLYGLYEMRQARIVPHQILVVEGYMDVVSLVQFGVRNVVATLGTATTQEHLELLFRQVSEVVFCFDGDAAGTKAAWKALDIALPMVQKERSARFLFLPQGEDPDSMVRKEGAEAFQQRMKQALSLSDFLLQGLEAKLGFRLQSIEGRQHYVALAEPYLKKAQGIYQMGLLEAVADRVGMKDWVLGRQLGIRSGTVAATKHPVRTNAAPKLKVLSLPLKIVRLLVRAPQWSHSFPEAILRRLLNHPQADHQLLGRALQQMQQSGSLSAEYWQELCQSLGYDAEELLPNSRANADVLPPFLQQELMDYALALAQSLEAEQLGQEGWSEQEMAQLAALKNRETR